MCSRHTGKTNFLFMDGSVHYLAENISDTVRRAIRTRAGAETFNLDL